MACMRDGFDQGRSLDNDRFVTVAPLNHGSFGMVLAAKDTTTGEDVAIKCITKPGATANLSCPAAIATDDRSEELAIHSRLQGHPNIVNLLHVFESEAHQYLVLELCNNGDLYEAIRFGKGPRETGHVRDFMLELVDAVAYLHSKGVYHRDIKPENIFLTSTGALKLGDFGLATMDTWSTEFAVGSDRYMAPEQFDASVYGYGYSPESADVWAIGIVLLNILFQRNPFGTPTQSDVLFADFTRDKQSLLDVFPSMSQDTYNVLVHCLALDPADRSLSAVRDALRAVVSFTIDDETLDDFCTEYNDLVPVPTAAREPLRTPSLTCPDLAATESFPWSTGLLKTPQKPSRQLSTIRDEEFDPFDHADSSWQYVDTDEVSLSSALDSGLGMSYKSTKSMQSSLSAKRNSGFIGSLPISFSKPTSVNSSPYGADGFSKSWSDLWDEEEEEQMLECIPAPLDECLSGMDIERVSTAKPSTPQLQQMKDEGRGSVTPRQGLASIDANVRSASPFNPVLGDDKALANPPKAKVSILDKWSALGNFRRAKQLEPVSTAIAVATPPRTKFPDAFASFAPFVTPKKLKVQAKPRERAPSWRQARSGSPQLLRSSSFNNGKIWQDDDNWRQHRAGSPMSETTTTLLPVEWVGGSSSQQQQQQRIPPKNYLNYEFDNDAEWVGGFSSLHL